MRLLILDQDLVNHDVYRRSFPILSDDANIEERRDDEALSGEGSGTGLAAVDCVYHVSGDVAAEEIHRSIVAGAPFAVAFVGLSADLDVKEWVSRIREFDPNINLVLVGNDQCLSPRELQALAGPPDQIFYLASPVEVAEIVQTSRALSRRWEINRELAAARTALSAQVAALEQKVAELATNEGRARHLASHDPLTEAPNRLAFVRALSERVRQPGMFAVAALDLDRFKLVNDSLGHLAGDEVIRQTCRTLRSVIPDGGMVARLAGDEFGLLFDTAGNEAAAMVCERLVAEAGVPMRVLGHKVQVSASAGVAVASESGARDPLDLMRQADLALNDAKRSGRNLARLYEPRMDEGVRVRRAVESGLGQAIARSELTMLFQPIVANGSFEIVGFEALMRWYADEFGHPSFIEDRRRREDHASFGVHASATGASHQVVEVPHHDRLLALLSCRNDEVADREVDALGERGRADDEAGQADLHRMFDGEAEAVRRRGMVREDAHPGGGRCRTLP